MLVFDALLLLLSRGYCIPSLLFQLPVLLQFLLQPAVFNALYGFAGVNSDTGRSPGGLAEAHEYRFHPD